MSEIVYLNGEFVPLEQALVPIDDRGYHFADGIYEVIRCYGGRPFLPDRHMDRLEHSAREIELALPPRAELEQALLELQRRNGHPEAAWYLQITRGVAPRQHVFADDLRPTVLATCRPVSGPKPELIEQGGQAITLPDERWHRCHIKSTGLLPNVLAKQQAFRAGAFEALFVRNGVVTEGTASNLAIVRDGVLLTHPADQHILWGITRGAVLQLCREAGIEVREVRFTRDDLLSADEAFVCGTISEITPITSVDDRKIGTGRPGPMTQRLIEAYRHWSRGA